MEAQPSPPAGLFIALLADIICPGRAILDESAP
jgi:hypothetical protein